MTLSPMPAPIPPISVPEAETFWYLIIGLLAVMFLCRNKFKARNARIHRNDLYRN
jgi:hypothetical protein